MEIISYCVDCFFFKNGICTNKLSREFNNNVDSNDLCADFGDFEHEPIKIKLKKDKEKKEKKELKEKDRIKNLFKEQKFEDVYCDSYRGFDFVIRYFEAPAKNFYRGYVRIPEDHPYYYRYIITHEDQTAPVISTALKINGWINFRGDLYNDNNYWIGWTYFRHGGNRELADVIKDCSSVIMQLSDM